MSDSKMHFKLSMINLTKIVMKILIKALPLEIEMFFAFALPSLLYLEVPMDEYTINFLSKHEFFVS